MNTIKHHNPYRHAPSTEHREHQRLLQRRIQELASVSPRFFLHCQRRFARSLAGWLSLAGLCLLALSLALGFGALSVVGGVWSLILLTSLCAGPLSRRHLALRLERSLVAPRQVLSSTRLTEVLLEAPAAALTDASLVGFLVLSFLEVTAALPWTVAPVFILSFLISASLFHLPSAVGGEPSARAMLLWALQAWALPALVLGLIVAGDFLACDLVVALGLGLLLSRSLHRQAQEEVGACGARVA